MTQSFSDNRVMRVIVTPSFSEIEEERAYLMAHTFPRMIHIAEERNVTLEFVWKAPVIIAGSNELTFSYDVEENRHVYIYEKVASADLVGPRRVIDGISHHDYADMLKLDRNVENSFVRLLDKVFPHTSYLELAKALQKASKIYLDRGEFEQALELAELASKELIANMGEGASDSIEARYSCAWLNYKLGNYAEAFEIMGKVVTLADAHFQNNDPRITDYLGVMRMIDAAYKR
ncbi:MAG: tetratricopeptide repeat protein [Paludibacteraceae bacterium]|nr:tetratricopeptide repeat protein [Paludibacteraceae bacterium]